MEDSLIFKIVNNKLMNLGSAVARRSMNGSCISYTTELVEGFDLMLRRYVAEKNIYKDVNELDLNECLRNSLPCSVSLCGSFHTLHV